MAAGADAVAGAGRAGPGVGGAGVGLGLRFGGHEHGGYGRFYGGIVDTVGDETRREQVRGALQAGREGWRKGREERNENWLAVADALEHEPYDEAAVTGIFAREVEADGERRLASRAALVKAFEIMTAEERDEVAEHIRAFVEMRRERKRRD